MVGRLVRRSVYPESYRSMVDIERKAATFRWFESLLIPGLLQTRLPNDHTPPQDTHRARVKYVGTLPDFGMSGWVAPLCQDQIGRSHPDFVRKRGPDEG